MNVAVPERRKSPRIAVTNHRLSLVTNMRARVVELGMGGLLLECAAPVAARMGRLRMPLGSGRFASEIDVRYERSAADGFDGVLVGAAFVDLSMESRQALERFLARATR